MKLVSHDPIRQNMHDIFVPLKFFEILKLLRKMNSIYIRYTFSINMLVNRIRTRKKALTCVKLI